MSERSGIKLVACLGNPGEWYANTRHNAGWQVADRLRKRASEISISGWQPRSGRLMRVIFSGNQELLLLYPMTFMNDSGRAIEETIGNFGLSPLELLVVCDCMDLSVGRLRLRKSGSSGGHRGIESVISFLQSDEFSRLRIGVGRPEPGTEVVDHVLSDWVSAEPQLHDLIFESAAECIIKYVSEGFDSACRFAGECSADKFNAKLKGETEIGKV